MQIGTGRGRSEIVEAMKENSCDLMKSVEQLFENAPLLVAFLYDGLGITDPSQLLQISNQLLYLNHSRYLLSTIRFLPPHKSISKKALIVGPPSTIAFIYNTG